MLNEQVRVARGLATSRAETVHTLPSADEIRNTLGAVLQQAMTASREREYEIVDAEIVELETPALPPAEQALSTLP
jgi:hypothetical protein